MLVIISDAAIECVISFDLRRISSRVTAITSTSVLLEGRRGVRWILRAKHSTAVDIATYAQKKESTWHDSRETAAKPLSDQIVYRSIMMDRKKIKQNHLAAA